MRNYKAIFTLETDIGGTTVSAKSSESKKNGGITYGKWNAEAEALRYLAMHCLSAAASYDRDCSYNCLDRQISIMRTENPRYFPESEEQEEEFLFSDAEIDRVRELLVNPNAADAARLTEMIEAAYAAAT